MQKPELNEFLKKILAIAFQSKRVEYLHEVLRIKEDFFLNPFWFQLVSTMADAMLEYGSADIDEEFLGKYFQKKKILAGPLLHLAEFNKMSVQKMSLPRFKLEIDMYLEQFSKVVLREALHKSMKDLDNSSYDTAKSNLYLEINTIDINKDNGQLPEGCFNYDLDDIMVYTEAAKAMDTARVFSGLPTIDSACGGFKPGDLVFILAYTGQGKSTLLQNIGYRNMLDKKNGIMFVNELQYQQLKIKLLSRHTANSKFWGDQLNGISTKSIEKGTVSVADKKILHKAIQDIKVSTEYGRIHIVQLPTDASINYIEAKMVAANSIAPLHYAIIDDLRLCRGGQKGDDKTVLSKVIVAAKSLAVNFNSGKGIPILSPWQTKQTAYEFACENGTYPINLASDTNEVEKQADVMIWLLRTEELIRKNQMLCGISKNRMGPSVPPFVLMERLEFSYINELSGIAASGTDTVPVMDSNEFDILLRDSLRLEGDVE